MKSPHRNEIDICGLGQIYVGNLGHGIFCVVEACSRDLLLAAQ